MFEAPAEFSNCINPEIFMSGDQVLICESQDPATFLVYVMRKFQTELAKYGEMAFYRTLNREEFAAELVDNTAKIATGSVFIRTSCKFATPNRP